MIDHATIARALIMDAAQGSTPVERLINAGHMAIEVAGSLIGLIDDVQERDKARAKLEQALHQTAEDFANTRRNWTGDNKLDG